MEKKLYAHPVKKENTSQQEAIIRRHIALCAIPVEPELILINTALLKKTGRYFYTQERSSNDEIKYLERR